MWRACVSDPHSPCGGDEAPRGCERGDVGGQQGSVGVLVAGNVCAADAGVRGGAGGVPILCLLYDSSPFVQQGGVVDDEYAHRSGSVIVIITTK